MNDNVKPIVPLIESDAARVARIGSAYESGEWQAQQERERIARIAVARARKVSEG